MRFGHPLQPLAAHLSDSIVMSQQVQNRLRFNRDQSTLVVRHARTINPPINSLPRQSLSIRSFLVSSSVVFSVSASKPRHPVTSFFSNRFSKFVSILVSDRGPEYATLVFVSHAASFQSRPASNKCCHSVPITYRFLRQFHVQFNPSSFVCVSRQEAHSSCHSVPCL